MFFYICLDRAVGLGSEGGGVSCMHRRLFEPIVGPFFLVFFLPEFYVILLGHRKDKRGRLLASPKTSKPQLAWLVPCAVC